MNQKIDLRIIKTKKSIYDATLKILGEKSFDEIKVSEICDVALINRSTFYSHFEDKYDLLDSMIIDIKNDLFKSLDENQKYTNPKQYYLSIISILLNEIDSQKNTYLIMFLKNKNSVAVDVLTQVLTNDIKKNLGSINNTLVPTDFLASYYIGAIVNVFIEWLKDRDKYSKDEVLKYIGELIND